MSADPTWSKDAWILRAIAAGALRVYSNGDIYRPGSFGVERVPLSTHKKTGRVYFNLSFENITKSVLANRVVGLALIPNPLNLPQVNHKDGVKANNHPDNLEWSTRSDNEKHAARNGLKANRGTANANAKLTVEDVIKIREAPEANLAALAITLSISAKTIRDIRERKTWKHV